MYLTDQNGNAQNAKNLLHALVGLNANADGHTRHVESATILSTERKLNERR